MSTHWLRHFALACTFGLLPLVSMGSVHASNLTAAQSNSINASYLERAARFAKSPPVMYEAAQFEANAPVRNFARGGRSSAPIKQGVNNPLLFREVFGFAFGSSLGDPTIGYPSWNFSLLSTVAYFGLHVTWTGDFSNDSGLSTWNNPYGPTPGFISAAHANGTKVVVTIIMMDSSAGTPNMCSALQRGQVTITNTVNQVLAKGIDGVNIDYESDNTQCYNANTGTYQSSQSLFTAFVYNMRRALPSSAYLSVDTYSGSAGYRSGSTYYGFFDIGGLAPWVDSFFVMAYDMEYFNWDSPPLNCTSFCIGPTSPLTTYAYNQGKASAEYRAVVPGSKVLMGIPYYGRKGCVAGTPSSAAPNAPASAVGADGYLDASTENGYYANSDYHISREVHDTAGNTRWDTWTSSTAGCTREMYWDDTVSLGNHYNLVINDGLRGIGIFALNYGGGAPELWSLINLKFGQCSAAAITADHTSPQIPGAAIKFTGTSFCAGTPQYRFWSQPPGGGWSITQDYGTSASWTWDTTGKALGTYQVELDARNLGSSVSYDTTDHMPMRLARCVTPTLTPDHLSPQLLGTTINFTASVTCTGTAQYRFLIQPPGGSAAVAQDWGSSATFKWDTSQIGYGNYGVEVDARTQGTTDPFESAQSLTYALTSCIAPALSTGKASPQPTGSTTVLSGSATCGGTPQYRFLVQPPGGSWAVVQEFGSANTYTWSAGGPDGTYGLEFDAKSTSAPASTMASAKAFYALTSCKSATLTPSQASPQVPGGSIALTGAASCQGTPQYRFWIRPPGGSWGVVQDYSAAATYNWNTTGLPVGDYGLEVDIRNTGAVASYETTTNQTFTLAAQACATPSLSSDLPSPQGTGVQVMFSATTATCPQPLYRFWILDPGRTTWSMVQDYGATNSYRWTATSAGGSYGVEVDVRDASRPVAYDAVVNTTYVLIACSGATITTDLASPQPPGVRVTLTGAATCVRPAEYRFWIQAPGASWSMVQDYSTTNTYSWNTASYASGSYRLEVDVRDRGVTATYETVSNATYVLTPPCATPTLTANPASPGPTGGTVTFTGATSACPIPEYRFWIRPPGGGWSIARDYASSATFAWTSGNQPATYGVEVDVREKGSTVVYDAVANINYQLGGCTSATLGADKASPQAPGTVIQLTATASCAGTAQYRFWIRPPGGGWGIVQDYGAAAGYSWNTVGQATGTYGLEVDVRNQGATSTYEAVGMLFFTLSSPPCASPTLNASKASPNGTGVSVTFTAATGGCPAPQFRFWIQDPGRNWTIVSDYGGPASYVWTGTGAPGTYGIEVDVRAVGSSVSYDAVANSTYTLNPCSGAALSPDKTSPQPRGTVVTLTGTASCVGTPEYRFWIRPPGGSWTIVQDYSPTATFKWDTTGLPAGTYYLEVDIRNHGANATYETVNNITFTLN